MDVQIHVFLSLALVGGEWSASRLRRFNPGKRALGTHWIGGLGRGSKRSGRRQGEKNFVPTGTQTPILWHEPCDSIRAREFTYLPSDCCLRKSESAPCSE
jgi:hypothetical protein